MNTLKTQVTSEEERDVEEWAAFYAVTKSEWVRRVLRERHQQEREERRAKEAAERTRFTKPPTRS